MKKVPQYNEFENGNNILRAEFIPDDVYKKIQEYTVIACHDVFIQTAIGDKSGILLVKRLREPAKNVMWPIGGRILRGLSVEESLQKKVLEECGLILTNIEYLGVARTTFHDEIYGHGHGSDTLNLFYWARGKGEVTLNPLHDKPTIVTKENYKTERDTFVSYVRGCLDIILEKKLW